MPLKYKLPAYVGNSLLLLLGAAAVANGWLLFGGGMMALAGLNLFLVRKLDLFSREEEWLAGELRKAQMREELAAIEQRLATSASPPQLSGSRTPDPQE